MKPASLKFKTLLIFTISIICLSAITTCDAQSIVGKWNRVSAKQFYTPEAAKTLGKEFTEVSMASTGVDVIEFKSDHTYTKTLSGKYQPKPITLTGTWTDTG